MSRHPRLVSVIVPVRDAEAVVGGQLACLAAQTYSGDWELVVSDNGSVDGTRAVVAAWAERFPVPVRVVDSAATDGAGPARNAGAAAATGDLLAFVDADDRADRTWLERLVEDAADHDLVGGALDEGRLNGPPSRRWRLEAQNPTPLPVAHDFLPYSISANVAVWADVFSALGGWRPDYASCEDVEFSWRAQRRGYTLGAAPDAVVAYRYRTDLRGVFRQYFWAGRYDARLYREFRHAGMDRATARPALLDLAWCAYNLPDLLWSWRRRRIFMRRIGLRMGRLRGSLAERVWFP